MVRQSPIAAPWQLIIPEGMYKCLHTHLFPGDGHGHAAAILAGVSNTRRGTRLLARDLHLAEDGKDYVTGTHTHHTLRAEFIRKQVRQARDEHLAYLAIHNHGGTDRVMFSDDDLHSQNEGYPALLDITRGLPVGAVVFAEDAAAGRVWTSHDSQYSLQDIVVVGTNRRVLRPQPLLPHDPATNDVYDRQTKLFGPAGQRILANAEVAIIGLGGVGSMLAEFLGRLGVGYFVLIDPDHVEPSNLPRLVGACVADAELATPKVVVAEQNIRRANPEATIRIHKSEVQDPDAIADLKGCDYMFLAADTMKARLIFNCLVHQYLIPGHQIGTKITSTPSGVIESVMAHARPVTPESGCLECNRLIDHNRLTWEMLSNEQRRIQAYVEDDDVVAPSVITLNASGVDCALNHFLFHMTCLAKDQAGTPYIQFRPLEQEVRRVRPGREPGCLYCSHRADGHLARGDSYPLPDVK